MDADGRGWEAADVELRDVLPSGWLGEPPVRIGDVAPGEGTPDFYVLVGGQSGTPRLRVDAYLTPLETAYFRSAMLWWGWCVVGFAHRVYLVSLDTERRTLWIKLDSYFGSLYAEGDVLLVASAERLYRLAPDGRTVWVSGSVGIDGVVVEQIIDSVIHGSGESDPPGGWKPFRVDIRTGQPVSVGTSGSGTGESG